MKASDLKVISWMYQKKLRERLLVKDLSLIGPTTKFALVYKGAEQSAYTTTMGVKNDILKVVLGGKMLAQGAGIPGSFETTGEIRVAVPSIIKAFYALNYHEMGHVLYTDMTLVKLKSGVEPRYYGFAMQLFNCLEDPVIELAITNHVERTSPYSASPRRYFAFLKKNLFKPDEYKDGGDVASFLNYLILICRFGKSKVAGTNAVYEKYNAELAPRIKGVLSEPDPGERQTKTAELANWMIENIKEFDWSFAAPPEDLRPMEAPEGVSPRKVEGIPSGSGKTAVAAPSSADDLGEEGEDEKKEPKDKDAADDVGGDGEEPSGDSGPEDGESEFLDCEGCFDEALQASASHEFVFAREAFQTPGPSIEAAIDAQINENIEGIKEISKFLTLFKSRRKPRLVTGFKSGSLDVFRAMQDDANGGCDLNVFRRKVERGMAPDLAVSLLCDNSGSMSGQRSHAASIAALALAQACEWADVPFECNAFTKTSDSTSGTAITIVEKEFGEPFAKAKPYFAVNDSDLCRKLSNLDAVPTFRGNSEETNLYYVWQKLRESKHRDKVLFVFCDGGTTGSNEGLASVVRRIEDDGITVIGIGLDANLSFAYRTSKAFYGTKAIKSDLPRYLMDTVAALIENGGRRR